MSELSRRELLRMAALTSGGITLSTWFGASPVRAAQAPKAKTLIQLWMGGGPSHLDTFDPKPEAGEEYAGLLRKPIATNVNGIRISELLPSLAKQADKFSILRAVTHGNNGHETATYIAQTGTTPSHDLVYPSIGAIVTYKRLVAGYKGALPPSITLTTPLGRFSEAGFLGPEFQTFATGGDPAAKDFVPQGLVVPKAMSGERSARRRSFLEIVDGLAKRMPHDDVLAEATEKRDRAYELMLGEAARAFDLSQEPEALREKYGRSRFGQSCLVARRLVERGVPFIRVNHGGWDTHKENFAAVRRVAQPLDTGFAALLEDLAQKGLLESTIVVWGGEFGRTPKLATEPPWNGGRHHWGKVFSMVVAGGGFKGGRVVGSSDAKGEEPKERPVHPRDLAATIYELMGIDPAGTLPHPQGCAAYVTPPVPAEKTEKTAGVLREIL